MLNKVVEERYDMYSAISYLESDKLSNSQDYAWHEALHTCDIMFDGVNLWPERQRLWMRVVINKLLANAT